MSAPHAAMRGQKSRPTIKLLQGLRCIGKLVRSRGHRGWSAGCIRERNGLIGKVFVGAAGAARAWRRRGTGAPSGPVAIGRDTGALSEERKIWRRGVWAAGESCSTSEGHIWGGVDMGRCAMLADELSELCDLRVCFESPDRLWVPIRMSKEHLSRLLWSAGSRRRRE